jgi:sarcosine oxidase subunit delta
MFNIYCPHCREHREEEEFHHAGQANLTRPSDPDNCSDEEWGAYLYFRDNPRGPREELWVHAVGCRKFFKVTRDTHSYQITRCEPLPRTVEQHPGSREGTP